MASIYSTENVKPSIIRKAISEGQITENTSGMCKKYVQANVVILPQSYAEDFKKFTQLNSKACPVLEVLESGNPMIQNIAENADIREVIPKYRIFQEGVFVEERDEIKDLWQDDFVTFLLGCSFSFENALIEANIPVRHIELSCNVPMYKTNLACKEVGSFSGDMVVSMRPIPKRLIDRATEISGRFPLAHGVPVHVGNPDEIGIKNIEQPDFGDAVPVYDDEVPVFWACGVTSQVVCCNAKPEIMITHAPGHMLITDIKDEDILNRIDSNE